MSELQTPTAGDSSVPEGGAGQKPGFSFPTAYTVLFALIALMALLTWVIPAGTYDSVFNEAIKRDVAVPNTYKTVAANHQTIVDVIFAPIKGLYDPVTGMANAIDVSLFVLIIGGFLGVVAVTGALDAGITWAMTAMRGREKWMIPILMALFAIGGTTFGMAEETLPFYLLIIPVMIAAGYDALTGVAIILIGAGIGVLGSTVNSFSTIIASNAAGIPFTSGLSLRLIILALGWLACVGFVMRYAARVKADPSKSIVADRAESNKKIFAMGGGDAQKVSFSWREKGVLILFGATFVVMVAGVSSLGWGMGDLSALFLGSSIVIGFYAWVGEETFTTAFVDGARDLLGVALIIGIARGIVVIMDAGHITDTILHYSEGIISGYSSIAYINVLYWVEVLMSFLVPSTSGLAVLSMSILAPLSDFAGVDRSLAVTAFQSACGIVNLVTPTSAVVIGGLALGRVPFERWLVFIWPLLILLTIIITGVISIGAFFN